MPGSERRHTKIGESVTISLRGHPAVEGVFRLCSSEFEIALDLHVDDGYVTRPAKKHEESFRISSRPQLFSKFSPVISVGSSIEHVGALRVIDVSERTAQERIVFAVDDEDERLPTIDESQAGETDWALRR